MIESCKQGKEQYFMFLGNRSSCSIRCKLIYFSFPRIVQGHPVLLRPGPGHALEEVRRPLVTADPGRADDGEISVDIDGAAELVACRSVGGS